VRKHILSATSRTNPRVVKYLLYDFPTTQLKQPAAWCKHPSDVNQLLLRFVKVDNYNDGMDNGVQNTLGGQGAGLEYSLTLLRGSPSAIPLNKNN